MTKLFILTSNIGSNVSSNAVSALGNQSGGTDYTVLFSIIGILVCIAIPLATILIGVMKYDGSFKQTLWGILGFLVFSYIVSALVCSIFFFGYSDQESTSFQTTIIMVIRLLCETLGMFLLLLFTKKRKGLGNALNFGMGYGLMECLWIGALLTFYLITSTSGNADNLNIPILRELRVYVVRENLVAGQEWRFIYKGFTALVFAAFRVSSSVVVFVSIQTKKYWLAGIAAIFGLLIRLPNRLHSFESWFWGNYAVIIPYLAVVTVLICLATHIIWKNHRKELT